MCLIDLDMQQKGEETETGNSKNSTVCTASVCPAFDITAHSMFTQTGLLMQKDAFSVRHCVNEQYSWGLMKKKEGKNKDT